MTQWICSDGGPLVLVPAAKRIAWRGSFVSGTAGDFVIETSSGPYGFRTDYDFSNPRSDYERAGAIRGLVGEIDVDGLPVLVLNDHPLATTWRPLADGGLFARKFTVELGADVESELAALPGDAEWSDEGIVLPGGEYCLMDALDHGEKPEQLAPVHLPDGRYRVFSADITTGRVTWSCIRLARRA